MQGVSSGLEVDDENAMKEMKEESGWKEVDGTIAYNESKQLKELGI